MLYKETAQIIETIDKVEKIYFPCLMLPPKLIVKSLNV